MIPTLGGAPGVECADRTQVARRSEGTHEMDTQTTAETYRDRYGNVLVPGDRVQWDLRTSSGLNSTGTVVPWADVNPFYPQRFDRNEAVAVREDGTNAVFPVHSAYVTVIWPAREDDATDDDDDAEASDASDPSHMTGDEVDLVMAVGTLALIAECLDEQSDNQQLAARFARTMLREFSKRMNIAECREHFVSGLQKVLDRDRERSADG